MKPLRWNSTRLSWLAGLAGFSGSAALAEVLWVGSGGGGCLFQPAAGSWFANGYWAGFQRPGPADRAVLQTSLHSPDNPGAYPHLIHFGNYTSCLGGSCGEITVAGGDAVVDELIVREGANWVFDFESGTSGGCASPAPLTGSLSARRVEIALAGNSAALTLRRGRLHATQESWDSIAVGQGFMSIGTLRVIGPDAEVFAARDVWLGNGGGRGVLEIIDGGSFTAVGGINNGIYTGPNGELPSGQIRVSGAGSQIRGLSGINLGTIEIVGGAQASSLFETSSRHYVFLGAGDGGDGRGTVSGLGSRWRDIARFTVGGVYHTDTNGRGTLTVADGGEVACDELIVGNRSRSSGEVLIAGTGTRLTADGWVVVGDDGMGTCHVDNRAELRCSELVIGSTTNGRGHMRLSGTAACANSGTLTVSDGGIGELQVSSGATLTTHDARIGNLERAGIEGNVRVTDLGSELSATDAIRLNRGCLSVFSGGAIIASVLEMNSPEAAVQGDGVIETVTVLHHAGRIRPGRHDSPSSPAIGELAIEGDWLQDDNAVLEIELARGTTSGTSDRMSVTGRTQLAGTLDLRRSGTMELELGDEFEIVTAAGIDGQFNTVLGQVLPAGRILRVDYGAQEVTLTVVEQTPGDTDCDGHIAFADIESFVLAIISREGFERAQPDCEYALADINRDGSVDFADIDAFVALLPPGS